MSARPPRAASMVLRQGLTTTGIGVGLGLAAAAGTALVLDHLLFGVLPADPLSLMTAAVLVAAGASLACWLPARRAASLDPAMVLRSK